MRCTFLTRPFLLFTLSLSLQSACATSVQQSARGEALRTSLWGRLIDAWHGGSRWTKWVPKLKYEEQMVLRFNISSASEEAALRRVVDQMFIDVWEHTFNWTDICIPRKRISGFLRTLPESLKEAHTIVIHDVARAIATTYPPTYNGDTDFEQALRERGETETSHAGNSRKHVDDLFFKDYQPLSVIESWMRLVDAMFSGDGLADMFVIGQSYEGRDIPALRIGKRPRKPTKEPRKTILITGGMHAREWIGVSTVNYLAWSFLTAFQKHDRLVTDILHEFDLIFVPVLNPDGYEYTWNVDRLWRKTRQPTHISNCPGFDLDHSFGYQWDASEHQFDVCSESYGGDEPFQAVEALQLSQWAINETEHNNVKFVAYIDLHSYSQQILWPYAYSCHASVPNLENQMEVAYGIAKYMRITTGEVYTVSSACEGVYLGSEMRRLEASGGAAIDYLFHDLGAKYSYQIKLRDTGSYGFLLPSDYIVPTGDEVFYAMRNFGDYLLGNNGIEHHFSEDEEQHVFKQVPFKA